MTDRQAAEARDEQVRDLISVHDDVTLAGMYVDASVRLAQAEQERDEQDERRHEAESYLDELRHIYEDQKVRLREYEEALTAIQAVGKHSRTVPSLQRIARDALAASGGREAPDTKEPA